MFFSLFRKKHSQNPFGHLIGRQGKVIEEINPASGKGKVKIGESWWIAVAENDQEVFRKGEIVTIKRMEGYRLIVGR